MDNIPQTDEKSSPSINKKVFFPTLIFLVLTISYSIYSNESFIATVSKANDWILAYFGWLFTWSAFLFLIILLVVYFSKLGKLKIGGASAQPILSRWKWFAIALCTTVATGILFWGMAEPLYHFNAPPEGLGITVRSPEAAQFALSTMFMHWTFTPYGIYTITGLVFALAYYNYKQPFSIGSLLYPLLGDKSQGKITPILDVLCLYALVSGMAASLGTGIYAIAGGLETVLQIPTSNLLIGIIGFSIVVTFIISAISGLKKGISILSNWNVRAFFVLAIVLFLLGPTGYILKTGASGLIDYVSHFLSRSTNIGANLDSEWLNNWTVFYFANWFAWAPVAALFLGRLGVGYTVRDFINYNLIFPCLFTCLWMMIFSGSALAFDISSEGGLYKILTEKGEENVMFTIFKSLPYGKIISIVTLIMVFMSYVTAADSNISAMSAMSSNGINPENPEAPLWIKAVWGTLIGSIAWVMLTLAGIDGIRLLCILGGFPALFIIILVGVGLVKLLFTKP